MKNLNVKNWILFIAVLISSISILLCIWNISNNSTKDARIDQIITILKSETSRSYNRDSLINQLQIHEFKEEYYVSQLGIQSDWLILYVSILFVITGFVGYTSFVNTIHQIDAKVDNAIKEQEKKHSIHVSEFKDMKVQILELEADLLESEFSIYSDKEFSWPALNSILMASLKYGIVSNSKEDQAQKETYEKLRHATLEMACLYVKLFYISDDEKKQKFFEAIDNEKINKILFELSQTNNESIIDIITDIRHMIKTAQK